MDFSAFSVVATTGTVAWGAASLGLRDTSLSLGQPHMPPDIARSALERGTNASRSELAGIRYISFFSKAHRRGPVRTGKRQVSRTEWPQRSVDTSCKPESARFGEQVQNRGARDGKRGGASSREAGRLLARPPQRGRPRAHVPGCPHLWSRACHVQV